MNVSPGGMYWQDPEAFTSTFVWKVASNLSSALQERRRDNVKTALEHLKKRPQNKENRKRKSQIGE